MFEVDSLFTNFLAMPTNSKYTILRETHFGRGVDPSLDKANKALVKRTFFNLTGDKFGNGGIGNEKEHRKKYFLILF